MLFLVSFGDFFRGDLITKQSVHVIHEDIAQFLYKMTVDGRIVHNIMDALLFDNGDYFADLLYHPQDKVLSIFRLHGWPFVLMLFPKFCLHLHHILKIQNRFSLFFKDKGSGIGILLFAYKVKAAFFGVEMVISGRVAWCFQNPAGTVGEMLFDMIPDLCTKSLISTIGVKKEKFQNVLLWLMRDGVSTDDFVIQQYFF